MGKLDGRTAVVTGAAMGNGEGIARVMARHGARVELWDCSERVFDTAAGFRQAGLEAVGRKVDVTDRQQCIQAAEKALQAMGRVDILCNNAGVARLALFEHMDDDLRDFHFKVNIIGVWNCTRALVTSMQARRYGKIVIISSVTGPMVVDPGMSAYATSKAALIGLTKGLARDLAPYNINVNAICPGYIRTPMVEHTARESNPQDPEAVIAGIASGVPLGRLGRPEEVGELAAFLASEEASYITGTQVVIDGGSTLPETMAVGVSAPE
jgi:NAD(P)-dependent dehydrogenase (short-subunit alcohol dehydrogenase family)